MARRIVRDLDSGDASGRVLGTPTLFVDGLLCQNPYDADRLTEAIAS